MVVLSGCKRPVVAIHNYLKLEILRVTSTFSTLPLKFWLGVLSYSISPLGLLPLAPVLSWEILDSLVSNPLWHLSQHNFLDVTPSQGTIFSLKLCQAWDELPGRYDHLQLGCPASYNCPDTDDLRWAGPVCTILLIYWIYWQVSNNPLVFTCCCRWKLPIPPILLTLLRFSSL